MKSPFITGPGSFHMATFSPDSDLPGATARPAVGKSSIVRGFLWGAVIAAVGLVAAYFWLRPTPMPPLSRQTLDAAALRWKEQGPADYDFRLVMSGEQSGEYQVEVRGGRVTRLVRNGVEPTRRGDSWEYWSVPGLLDVIEIDLAAAQRESAALAAGDGAAAGNGAAARDGAAADSRLRLWAEFDDQWGYPRRYRRAALGTGHSTEWRMTDFSTSTGRSAP
jgi:hypothetical protein